LTCIAGLKISNYKYFLKPILSSSDLKRGTHNGFEVEVKAGERDTALTIVLMLVNLKYAHVHQFHLNRRLVLGAASFCSELAPG
jgi:hypothetical protein